MKATRTIIEPQKKISFQFSELWQYRELFYFFTWRDIKVKYKQTYLGIIWALLQPLALMFLFTLVFAKHFSPAASVIDYRIFVLAALLLWTLFFNATSHAAESILVQSNIIKKIYFPRLIIIGSSLLTALFDFVIAFAILLVCCLIFQQPISWQGLLLFPAGTLLVLASSFGMGTLLAALNVRYRDFRYALPFLLQFLFFASQIVYTIADITQPWAKLLLSVNPINAAIELFRMALGVHADLNVVLIGITTALVLTICGILYFKKTEAYFADLA